MKKILAVIPLLSVMLCCMRSVAQNNNFYPGTIWNDVDGSPINAHGGGILYEKGTYYWFGEIKTGKTIRVEEDKSWENFRVNAGGISCYSSKDLVHWKYEGVALKPELKDSSSELFTGKVVERPKVVYNAKTKQYVMWLHIDSKDYSYARAGVAVSKTPAGPYTYVGAVRPNGAMSRDMTLFKDEDGRAYLICTSENNQTMHVNLLNDDYTKPTTTFTRILVGQNREAPAIVKHNSKYFLITSLCSGWDANAARYAVADSMLGNWQVVGNPCVGADSGTTFQSQSAYIIPVAGKKQYIFMADRWKKTDLPDSRYIWLPLQFEGDKIVIEWKEKWHL
jgi:hypothetical protein